MKKFNLILTLILLTSGLLTGCRGKDAPSTNLKVAFTDYHYTPDTFIVPAGKEITITAINNGTVTHEFVIMKFGTSAGKDFGPEDEVNIYWEVSVDVGGSTSVTFTMPSQPGEYQVVCGLPGHYLAGMAASLVVK